MRQAKLTSVTGWNAVSAVVEQFGSVSNGHWGTLPTTFSVEVQGLAKAQATASASLLPVGGALGQARSSNWGNGCLARLFHAGCRGAGR